MKGTIRSYLSVSQIRKYMTCGMQYYFRYVEGIPEKMGSAVLRGTSVDNAANEHFSLQAQTNNGLTQSQFVDFAVDVHEKEQDSDTFDWEKDDITKDKSKDRTSKLAATYHKDFGDKFKAKEVQVELVQVDNDGEEFKGFADFITVDGVIVDNKVKKRNVTPDLTRDVQLVKYADMANVDKVGMAVVQDLDTPKTFYHHAEVTQDHKDRVNKRIEHVKSGINNQVVMPAPEGSWACTQKWCSFWEICEFGK